MPAITHLIRPEIADLDPYVPIAPLDVLAEQLGLPVEQIVKLDANENPYGPSLQAVAALANEPHYAIYPDPESRRLRAALSDYTGQPVERIVCGTGADELIDLLLRLFLQPGDAVIDCPPTFGMYAFDTAVNGGHLVEVPRRADFSLDLLTIEQVAYETGAKVLFIASPNNPDGSQPPRADIEQLLKLPLLVVVDEAYYEFAGSGMSEHVGEYDNLVVLRTFSKWAGLAGLRIGYALLPVALAAQIWKIKQPYNVNLAAQVAALAALHDTKHRGETIKRVVNERERLRQALRALPDVVVYPSQTNFLLCHITTGRAAEIKRSLAQQGILVRYYNKPLLRDYLRISVGRPEQNERLLATLRQLLGGQA